MPPEATKSKNLMHPNVHINYGSYIKMCHKDECSLYKFSLLYSLFSAPDGCLLTDLIKYLFFSTWISSSLLYLSSSVYLHSFSFSCNPNTFSLYYSFSDILSLSFVSQSPLSSSFFFTVSCNPSLRVCI